MQQINSYDKPRTLYFDILRFLACCLVILTHSAMPAVNLAHGPFYTFFSTLAVPSSELFLCISGAILLPISKPAPEFLRARFTKLLYPVVFWSVITSFFFYVYGEYGIREALLRLIFIPVKPVHGVYWFVYAICGLYLIAPFISKWLIQATKKELQLFLLLWGITLIYPILNYFIPDFYDLDGSYYNMFANFGGFIGYMILGVYLRKYPIELKGGAVPMLLLNIAITTILFSVILICKLKDIDTSILTDNLSLFSAIAVVNIFTLGQTICKFNRVKRLTPFFSKFAKYSFGIYLCHMIVIRCLWLLFADFRLHPIIETPLICLLSVFVAFCVVRLMSKLPFSKFIVGI